MPKYSTLYIFFWLLVFLFSVFLVFFFFVFLVFFKILTLLKEFFLEYALNSTLNLLFIRTPSSLLPHSKSQSHIPHQHSTFHLQGIATVAAAVGK